MRERRGILIAEMTGPELSAALANSPGVIIPLGSTEILFRFAQGT